MHVAPVVLLLVCVACFCGWRVFFLCRVLCISVLRLVFLGFGTKNSPLRTSFSAVVSLLLLRLTIASVVLGC